MTTDTDLNTNVEEVQPEVKRDYEEDDIESMFYVEKSSRLIYEVKLFPEFALVRPAHPDFSSAVERVDLIKFAGLFDEYLGDMQAIRDFLWGADVESLGVEKK